MNKDTTNKMCVVKKYHTLINKEAGYADFVRVGFLPFRSIFSLAFERKLNTGCGKAPQKAFPNRQALRLANFGLANSISQEMHEQRKPKPAMGFKRSEETHCGLGLSRLGGSSKGATPFMFISPLGEKKTTN